MRTLAISRRRTRRRSARRPGVSRRANSTSSFRSTCSRPVGHLVEHERERGDRARGRDGRRQGASERRCHNGQSSNDVIPTAIQVSAALMANEKLLPALAHLKKTLDRRARELRNVTKTGRTHLMDAMPVTFGQELGGWAAQIRSNIERNHRCAEAAAPPAAGRDGGRYRHQRGPQARAGDLRGAFAHDRRQVRIRRQLFRGHELARTPRSSSPDN